MSKDTSKSDKHLIHPDELPESIQTSSKATRNIIFAVIVIVILIIIFLAWR